MTLRRRARAVAAQAASPQVGSRAKARALAWVARSPFRTRLWYVGRRAYVREQQAMLAGIAAYHDAEADRHRGPVFRLRRNVHRIEKGLSVPERRSTFAEDYIEETADAFAKVVLARDESADATLDATIAWAADVLAEYFTVVEPTIRVKGARLRFESADPGAWRDGTRVPQPKDGSPCAVEPDALLRLARRRRSVRTFLPEPVPRDVIDAAVEVARQSPSACNRQAFQFRVFDEPSLTEEMVELAPGFDAHGRKVPVMIAVVGRYRAYFRERDMHVIYVDASLAAMSMVYAFETLGYASCCINWPSIPARDRKMADFLDLDDDEEVVMLMAVGRADPSASSPFSEKVPLESIRRYNRG